MDWKTHFRDYILERGRKYYQNHRVSGLSYKDGLYRARVLGEVPYNVEVKVKDDQISYMMFLSPCSRRKSMQAYGCYDVRNRSVR